MSKTKALDNARLLRIIADAMPFIEGLAEAKADEPSLYSRQIDSVLARMRRATKSPGLVTRAGFTAERVIWTRAIVTEELARDPEVLREVLADHHSESIREILERDTAEAVVR